MYQTFKSRTFKLLEGGAATKDAGTQRASKNDIINVANQLTKVVDMTADEIAYQFVGSTPLVLDDQKPDCGDIDFCLFDTERDKIIQRATSVFASTPKKIGDSIFSFAVDTGGKKVQLDMMFVTDIEWAKFAYYADPESNYKSGVRNELIHAALRSASTFGKDIIVKDEDGNIIAKVARSYILNKGVKRTFKMAKPRVDGDGYTTELQTVTPDQIQALLDEYGIDRTFSSEEDFSDSPNELANMLFGGGVTPDDMSSAEKMIQLIREKKGKKARKIFADAEEGMRKRGFDIPEEMTNVQNEVEDEHQSEKADSQQQESAPQAPPIQ